MNQAIQYLFVRELICKESNRTEQPFVIANGINRFISTVSGLVSIAFFIVAVLTSSGEFGAISGFSFAIFIISFVVDTLMEHRINNRRKELNKQLALVPEMLQNTFTLEQLKAADCMKVFFPEPPKEKKKK